MERVSFHIGLSSFHLFSHAMMCGCCIRRMMTFDLICSVLTCYINIISVDELLAW